MNLWQELDEPEYNHFFVKKVVTRALDKHNHEREMASILLSALLGEVKTLLLLLKTQLHGLGSLCTDKHRAHHAFLFVPHASSAGLACARTCTMYLLPGMHGLSKISHGFMLFLL